MKTEFLFSVKFYHSQGTYLASFTTFEQMDEEVQRHLSNGGRCESYELRNGKTINPYTEEEVNPNKQE